jgi:hypothetical protein
MVKVNPKLIASVAALIGTPIVANIATNGGQVRPEEWKLNQDGSATFRGFQASPIQLVGTVDGVDVVLNTKDDMPEDFKLEYSQRIISRKGEWYRGGDDKGKAITVKSDVKTDAEGKPLDTPEALAKAQAEQLTLEGSQNNPGLTVGVTGGTSFWGPVFSTDFKVTQRDSQGNYIRSQEAKPHFWLWNANNYSVFTDNDQNHPDNANKTDAEDWFKTFRTIEGEEQDYQYDENTNRVEGFRGSKDLGTAFDWRTGKRV